MSVEIERLRALLEAATPGPWRVDLDGEHVVVHGGAWRVVSDAPLSDPEDEGPDFRAIAALMSVAPQLLAVAEAANCRIPQWCSPPGVRHWCRVLFGLHHQARPGHRDPRTRTRGDRR